MSVSIHLKNLSANFIQIIVNQLCGVYVFWILSTSFNKQEFGDFNWSLAVLLAVFNLLALGIDQLLVRKIAAGADDIKTTGLYLTHALITGTCFWLLLILLWLLLPGGNVRLQLLATLGMGKLMLYFSNPFKQLVNGKEQFGLLTVMSVGAGIVKSLALLLVVLLHLFNLQVTVWVFVLGETIELAIALWVYIFYLKLPLLISFKLNAYKMLLKEARHQAGVVLFTSALSRFDWIFIGLFLSSVKLAEYSFAYKIFEVSTLPLAAIGTLILPRFSKIIRKHRHFPRKLFNLLNWVIAFATLTALVLNLCWPYFADLLTGNKYGAVNIGVVFILSLSVPFLYLNNFLWSIVFAKGQTRLILQIFSVTFGINLAGDLLLIPLSGNVGAALGYFMAIVVQSILFCAAVKEAGYRPLITAFANLFLAAAIGWAVRQLFTAFFPVLSSAIILYILLIALSRQLKTLRIDEIEKAAV